MSLQPPPSDPYGQGPRPRPYRAPPGKPPFGQRLGLGAGLGVIIGIILPVVIVLGMWATTALGDASGAPFTGMLFWVLAGLPVLMLVVGAALMVPDNLRAYGVALMTASGVSIITSAGLCVLVLVGAMAALSQSH